MRRFYEILQRSVLAFLLWFGALTVLVFCDCTRKELMTDPYRSCFFWVLQLPLYGIILFGCYALLSIGWHLFTLSKLHYLVTVLVQRTATMRTWSSRARWTRPGRASRRRASSSSERV
jgi:hypothetical protein